MNGKMVEVAGMQALWGKARSRKCGASLVPLKELSPAPLWQQRTPLILVLCAPAALIFFLLLKTSSCLTSESINVVSSFWMVPLPLPATSSSCSYHSSLRSQRKCHTEKPYPTPKARTCFLVTWV